MKLKHIPICFFKLFSNKKPSHKEFKKIFKEGTMLTKKGWTVSNITNRMVAYHKSQNRQPNNLFEIINKKQTPPLKKKGNILENRFYYHNVLHLTSPPTTISLDHETGTINKKENLFYLEIKEFFSINDLTKYFHKKMKNKNKDLFRMNRGGFKKMIKDYDLDLILFTIDVSKRTLKEKDFSLMKNYSQLFNYITKGEEQLKIVKNFMPSEAVPYYKAYVQEELI